VTKTGGPGGSTRNAFFCVEDGAFLPLVVSLEEKK
jgi:hypothetical protein